MLRAQIVVFALLRLLLFSAQSYAQAPEAAAAYPGLRGGSVYSAGYIIGWNSPEYTRVTVYGRNGEPIYALPEFKEAGGHYHPAWAIDSDGFAARADQVFGPWEGRIELLDPSGRSIRTIDTGSYLPQLLAFGPDHSLWAIGPYAGNDGFGGDDFNVLHHYSRTGKELGQGLPWSQIKGDHNSYTALQPIVGARYLFVSKDRIGLVSRASSNHLTWLEIGFDAALLGTYQLANIDDVAYLPRALTDSGKVYAEVYKDRAFAGWAILNRADGSWHNLSGYPEGRVIGSEGDRLVFLRVNADNVPTVRFVPVESLVRQQLSAKR